MLEIKKDENMADLYQEFHSINYTDQISLIPREKFKQTANSHNSTGYNIFFILNCNLIDFCSSVTPNYSIMEFLAGVRRVNWIEDKKNYIRNKPTNPHVKEFVFNLIYIDVCNKINRKSKGCRRIKAMPGVVGNGTIKRYHFGLFVKYNANCVLFCVIYQIDWQFFISIGYSKQRLCRYVVSSSIILGKIDLKCFAIGMCLARPAREFHVNGIKDCVISTKCKRGESIKCALFGVILLIHPLLMFTFKIDWIKLILFGGEQSKSK